MNIINKIFNFQQREAVRPQAQSESEGQSGKQPEGGNYRGMKVHIGAEGYDTALSVSAWYCASERLANTMSQMILEYRKKNSKSQGNNYSRYDRGTGKRLNYLLQVRPNPLMTAHDFITRMTLARFWKGNAVAYIERDENYEPVAFWPCSEAVYNLTTGKYNLQFNRPTLTSLFNVDPEDVIHWRNTFTELNGLIGVGTLRYAAQSLSISATNDKQALENASKGGKMKLLLTEDKSNASFGIRKLNKEQKNKQQQNLQQALDEGQDVLMMSGLLDAKPISQDASQMQLLESRKFDVPTISRFSGVPPAILMDYANNTYKAPEQAVQDFLLWTIAPMAHSLETELSEKLIGYAGWGTFEIKFIDESLMRLDPIGRANISKVLLDCGIMSPNELRLDYDLPAIEHGDEHYISTNLQPLSNPVVGAKTLAPGNYTVADNTTEEE